MLLATEARWSEFSAAVALPENLAECGELMARLEKVGDASAQCGMIQIARSTNARKAAKLGAPIARLYQKLGEAKRRLQEEMDDTRS